MIILSIGMPRAGSGWYYNLTHDLIKVSGGQDAREIRKKYRLGKILTEVNCNIGTLSSWRLSLVLIPALLGNTFTIKTHAGPTRLTLLLVQVGLICPTYIYRDPRDAMISAMDNGRKARAKGRRNAFSQLTDFNAAVEFMLSYLKVWEAWIHTAATLHTRYENLLGDYDAEVLRLIEFLPVPLKSREVDTVLERYRPEKARGGQKGIHYSKGQTGRYREIFTNDELSILNDKFGPYLEQMGYEMDYS
jgi:hypothetical protein